MSKSLEVAYMATKDAISITLNGRFRTFMLSTDQGQKLLEAVKQRPQDIEAIGALADVATYINRHTFGRVTIDDRDQIRLDGNVVDYGLSEIIVRLVTDGSDVSHLTKFVENVAQNPDQNVAPQIYAFLEKGEMPITPDGCFHAFKRVDENYKSFHSGKEDVTIYDETTEFDFKLIGKQTIGKLSSARIERGNITHNVGSLLVMARDVCDPNRDQTCSVGLHACSPGYLDHWYASGKLLIVKINPRDVTAVPTDYNEAKLRCRRMEIVAEIPNEDVKGHFNKAVETRYTRGWSDKVVEGYNDPKTLLLKAAEELARGEEAGDLLIEVPGKFGASEFDDGWTVEEAAQAGIDDGENAAEFDGEFVCDFMDGILFEEIPVEVELAYGIAYTMAYVASFTLAEPVNKKVFKLARREGRKAGNEDRQNETFAPFFSEGGSFDAYVESNLDEYGKGYVTGYLKAFLKDGTESTDDEVLLTAINAMTGLISDIGDGGADD